MFLFLLSTLLAGMLFPYPNIRVHEPIHHNNLTIFPVTAGTNADASGFLTLDEGLAKGVVKVGELGTLRGAGMVRPIERRAERPSGQVRIPEPRVPQTGEQAQVNELAIQNLSDQPLILLAGEVVSGGKQDRVVGRDRIVPPHSEPLPLNVFCVEPGRWHGLSAGFAAANAMANPSVRKEVVESKDQQKVWSEVRESRAKMAMAVVPSTAETVELNGTTSYAGTVNAKPIQDELGRQSRDLLQSLPAGTIGVVVAVNGRLAWADLFASPALFARYRDKLLQSYLVEAMRSGAKSAAKPTAGDANDFLRILTGRQTIEVEPDLYRLVRTEAAGTITYELDSLAPKTVTLHVARMAQ